MLSFYFILIFILAWEHLIIKMGKFPSFPFRPPAHESVNLCNGIWLANAILQQFVLLLFLFSG